MANEEEGISIPNVPKPIPKPTTTPAVPAADSERELPEAPSPRGIHAVPEQTGVRKHVATPEHVHTHHASSAAAPPLFIKIDKYQEVVDSLRKLKSISLSLRDALDALADIEKELTTGITISHKALDDFNTIISILDSKLMRMGELGTGRGRESPGDLNTYVRGIYDQMDKIKQDLKNVSEEVG